MPKINLKFLIPPLLILFIIFNNVLAYELEVPLGEEKMVGGGLAQYISFLFKFGLGVAGLLALAMIIFGAIQYTTSAGNVARQQDAKDRITNAIYGVVLLLGSYLLLYTINPTLVSLKNPEIDKIGALGSVARTNQKFAAAINALQSEAAKRQSEIKKLEEDKKNISTQIVSSEEKIKQWEAARDKETDPKEKLILSIAIKEEQINLIENRKTLALTSQKQAVAEIERQKGYIGVSTTNVWQDINNNLAEAIFSRAMSFTDTVNEYGPYKNAKFGSTPSDEDQNKIRKYIGNAMQENPKNGTGFTIVYQGQPPYGDGSTYNYSVQTPSGWATLVSKNPNIGGYYGQISSTQTALDYAKKQMDGYIKDGLQLEQNIQQLETELEQLNTDLRGQLTR